MIALEKLKAALNALPVRDDRRHMVDRLAVSLFVAGRLAAVNDLPRTRHVGPRQALKELDRIRKAATQLRTRIMALSRTALAAIGSDGGTSQPFQIAIDVDCLCEDAAKAYAKLAAQKSIVITGAKKKRHAAQVQAQAASYYKELTGRPPTITVDGVKRGHRAGGSYVRFLEQVFEALEIRASAGAQAKVGRKEKTLKI